jgi:polysaccharide chain length determinant protein (PEP-CTERM system associated)
MPSLSATLNSGRLKSASQAFAQISPEHYLRLILHRKWLIITTFLTVTAVTVVVVSQLPDFYTSETLILVESQKVPESYVRPTVTGDVRSRLNTLEQQILSATRLQTIIDGLKLYPEERKKMAREDVITQMRRDILISLVSDFGRQDVLQAFKIAYSGRDPRLVARVVSELAALFIDENLKAREEQATGTTEFLESQLQDTRKALESQESQLRDFRLKHIGEMPEQETADLQILGHLQSELHLVGEAVARAEQQRSLTQTMMSQSAPIVNIDEEEDDYKRLSGEPHESKPTVSGPAPIGVKAKLLDQLNERLKRGYTESHPDIRKLRAQIATEEAKEPKVAANEKPAAEPTKSDAEPNVPVESVAARPNPIRLPPSTNPILVTQLRGLDAEIVKQREEEDRLKKQIAAYQAKLEAIPVRQQQITELVRDYEISKAHYSQLLDKQLSAETATQLEIRQKGEKFKILDPAQPAERPSKPNRKLLDAAGALGGLVLGLVLALSTEFLGMSITAPEQVTEASGLAVLEVIPLIETHIGRRRHKRQMLLATVSGALFAVLACCAVFFYRYRG